MKQRLPPGVASALALLWCLAQAADAPHLAAGIAVASLLAAASTVLLRRGTLALRIALIAVAAIVACVFIVLLDSPVGSRWAFAIQLGMIAGLAPVLPLVYAATFPPDADGIDRE